MRFSFAFPMFGDRRGCVSGNRYGRHINPNNSFAARLRREFFFLGTRPVSHLQIHGFERRNDLSKVIECT
jgi:hypothetical protein